MKKNELTKEELMAIVGGQDEMNLAVLAEDAPYGEIIRRLNGRENLEDLLNGTDRRVLDLLIKRRQGSRNEIIKRRLPSPVVMRRELAETRNLQ